VFRGVECFAHGVVSGTFGNRTLPHTALVYHTETNARSDTGYRKPDWLPFEVRCRLQCLSSI